MRTTACLLVLISIFVCGCDPYQRGNLMLKRGQYEKAAEFFYQRTIEKPDEPRARNQLGYAYLKLENYPDAIQEFRIAITLDNDYYTPYNNLGLAYMGVYNWPKAQAVFSEALKLKPDSEEAHVNIAWCYEKMWMADEALEHAKRARELSGENNSYAILFDAIAKTKIKAAKYEEKMKKQQSDSEEKSSPGEVRENKD